MCLGATFSSTLLCRRKSTRYVPFALTFVIVPLCDVFPEAFVLYLALTFALTASAPRGGGGGATTRNPAGLRA